ncbi:liprin-beta-1 isoform X2 [Nematostella vectensis]|uniref:liprin-beta-1 isoform X2 n=1 Tax=Nematostella vectensis TaxID=45351 RepID=UPI001390479C|nr:liprin-beta-1 isoform X2 [Nematostella vectensis]
MAIVADDAATMLAEALEKMDDLISDDQLIMEAYKFQMDSSAPNGRIESLTEELRDLLSGLPPSERATVHISDRTSDFLASWLEALRNQKPESQNLPNGESSRAQIDRLEDEKDSLILQVSVLTDQVEAQGEKMRDLEFTLEEQKIRAEDLEQQLEKEKLRVSQSAKEKQNLLSEIETLRIPMNNSSRNTENGDNLTSHAYKEKLAEKESEIEALKDHIESLLDEQETLQKAMGDSAGHGLKSQLREKASEVNKLTIEVETLNAVVEDKDKKINDLQQALGKFRRVEDMVVRAHQRVGSEASQSTPDPYLPDTGSINSSDGIFSPSPSVMTNESPTNSATPHQLHAESYLHAVHNPVTPSLHALQRDNNYNQQAKPKKTGIRSSFGRGLRKLRGPKSSSEPNVYAVERSAEGKNGSLPQNQPAPIAQPTDLSDEHKHEKKTIGKRIGKAFGKLRRTKSLSTYPHEHDDSGPIDLDRFRRPNPDQEEYGDTLELPFARWPPQMIMNWLDDLGLGCYTDGCQRNIKCGEDLLRASGVELDRQLGIRHPLHRKKLQLALQAFTSDSPDVMGRLSNHWVLGWLEDIGLPHYKDAFSDACVDGRMLNHLTLDDLQHLKVTNALHHVSIQRAIQCLRFYNFHPNCLKRYPIDESWQQGADVLLWTNGRVMEWLRLVDLAEYAPNLRGSGVHGALMILEPRFTPETLAALLSIPSTKTLLRRHLASHFQSLVGTACSRTKDEAAADPGFTPLMPGVKHKVMKKSKSLGALRKKSKDSDMDNYVCPMDLDIPTQLRPAVTQRARRRPEDEFNRRNHDSDDENMLDQEGHLLATTGNP